MAPGKTSGLIFTVLLNILFFNAICAQSNNIKPLLSELSTATSDTQRIDLLTKIGQQYKATHLDSALLYFNQAQKLAGDLKDHVRYAKVLFRKVSAYDQNGQLDSAYQMLEKGLFLARKHHLAASEGLFHSAHARLLEKQGQLDSSMTMWKLAGKFFIEANNNDYLSVVHSNLAVNYQKLGQYDSALVYTQKAIDYKIETDQEHNAVNDYSNMGILYLCVDEPDMALPFHHKSIALLDTAQSMNTYGWILSNLGYAHKKLGQLDSALYYGQKAQKIAQDNHNNFGLFNTAQLIGQIHILNKDYKLAAETFKLGLSAAKQTGDQTNISTMHANLGDVYLKIPQTNQALLHLDTAYSMSLQIGSLPNQTWTSNLLSQAWAQNSNFDSAYHYLFEHKTLYDSVRGIEQSKKLIELERQYQTERQAKVLARQKLELQQKNSTIRNYVFFFLISLLILIGIFQFIRYKQKLISKETANQLEIQVAKSRQLEELNDIKSQFFANISHEFRTPLTLITSPILNLQERLINTTDENISVKRSHLEMIQRNAFRLQNLVDQILDLSKIDSGYMTLNLSYGDVMRFVKMLTFSFESLAERKEINFNVEFTPDTLMGYMDEDKVEKILVNLLSNAFKYTHNRGSISVKTAVENQHLIFSIQDSGMGMTQEQLSHIFDRFYQVDNNQGAGIGLALVHELTNLYGGNITATSIEKEGSKFTVRLPFQKSDFQKEGVVIFDDVPSSDSTSPTLSTSHLSVDYDYHEVSESSATAPLLLVVEDNDELRAFIAETMSVHFRVIQAENGEVGESIATTEIPDIIISDVMMPRKDGLELCKAIKQNEKTSHIPVILLTAKAGDQPKIQGLETGADDYLTKPFSGQELKIRSLNLVHQRRLLKEKFGSPNTVEDDKMRLPAIDQAFLEKVYQTINEELDNEHFSVEDLAHKVAFSRSQLHRKLKAIIDLSPTEVIRNHRLDLAFDMLKKGEGNVSEIAHRVGYSNLSYFTKSFKQKFNKLPSEV